MKTVATLNGRHPQVNISMAVLKYTAKKQYKEQTLQRHVTKRPDIERVAALATLTHKPTSFISTLKNTTEL